MNVSVLVMSCDAYSDLWKPFNTLYKKHWEHPYKTYIGTETKECEYFETIKAVGSWTSRVRQTLEKIDSEYVIFLLEDFFFHKKVNQERIEALIPHFNERTAVFNFELNKDTKTVGNAVEGFKKRLNNQIYLCSCQPSLWNRCKLIELLQKDMTPHEWEVQILDSEYDFYINTTELIMDIGYYEDRKPWCVVQGKWAVECRELFEKENIKVDFLERGFFDMKLSIIIPYYKTLDLTKKLLDKLVPQLTKEVEVILIDDGCNEKELDKYSIQVIHKQNEGPSVARNIGLDKASGKYIAFVDSDDMVSDNYISRILEEIPKNYDYFYISWKNNKGDKYIIENEPPEFNKSIWNCVYKRELIGDKRFRENIQYGEDWDFNDRVRKGKKGNVTDILYTYNVGREESLTDLYCKGKIKAERPLKAQLVMFLRFVSKIGGIETFLYEFFKENHDKHDILFLYEEADPHQIQRYSELVRCHLYLNERVECETFLNVNATKNIADNVVASSGNYLDMCHTDYASMGWVYTAHPKTTLTICVSKVVEKAVKLQYPKIKTKVIHNLLNIKPDRALFLVSATRLSWEKGYNRMKTFAKRLNELNKSFIWLVFTNDVPDEEIDGFVFMKPRLNVTDYVNRADYLVQLSNTEADGYATKEAMYMGIPLIVTNYPSIYEQGFKVGENGYVVEMDLSNMDKVIKNMYSKKLDFKPIRNDYSKLWDLGKQCKSDYVYSPVKVVKTTTIEDRWIVNTEVKVKDDMGIRKNKGEEVVIKSTERIRMLLENYLIKRLEE
jgi:glycosyltransferase involved in cell wall biosynthesis